MIAPATARRSSGDGRVPLRLQALANRSPSDSCQNFQISLAAGLTYTTLELKVAYHLAITSKTGLVRAEGRVLSFGRRAAFSEAKLVDAESRLLASATSSLLVLSP